MFQFIRKWFKPASKIAPPRPVTVMPPVSRRMPVNPMSASRSTYTPSQSMAQSDSDDGADMALDVLDLALSSAAYVPSEPAYTPSSDSGGSYSPSSDCGSSSYSDSSSSDSSSSCDSGSSGGGDF